MSDLEIINKKIKVFSEAENFKISVHGMTANCTYDVTDELNSLGVEYFREFLLKRLNDRKKDMLK